jgi:hypothetical protein
MMTMRTAFQKPLSTNKLLLIPGPNKLFLKYHYHLVLLEYWIKSLKHQSLLFDLQHSLSYHVLTRLCKYISYLKPFYAKI